MPRLYWLTCTLHHMQAGLMTECRLSSDLWAHELMKGQEQDLQPSHIIDLYEPQALAPGLESQVEAVLWKIDDDVLAEDHLHIIWGPMSSHPIQSLGGSRLPATVLER